MSFQAVGPEDPKECSPKLVVQDRGTVPAVCLLQLNITEDGQERRSVTCRSATGSRVPDDAHLYVSRHNLNVTCCG